MSLPSPPSSSSLAEMTDLRVSKFSPFGKLKEMVLVILIAIKYKNLGSDTGILLKVTVRKLKEIQGLHRLDSI